MHQIPSMKQATEHAQGVIDVAESNGDIKDGIGGHLGHVRCKKQPKIAIQLGCIPDPLNEMG
jgi:hypothetical protein